MGACCLLRFRNLRRLLLRLYALLMGLVCKVASGNLMNVGRIDDRHWALAFFSIFQSQI
jgi:hypothetical protein